MIVCEWQHADEASTWEKETIPTSCQEAARLHSESQNAYETHELIICPDAGAHLNLKPCQSRLLPLEALHRRRAVT